MTDMPYSAEIQTMISYFNGIRELAFEEVMKFRGDLVKIQDTADEMDQRAESFNWAFWVAAAFALALAVLCFLMMITVVLAWKDYLFRGVRCFRMTVIVPLFIFLVIVSWVFAVVFVIGSMAVADTCIDSPDERVLSVVDKYRDELDSIITDFLIYYISGKFQCCKSSLRGCHTFFLSHALFSRLCIWSETQ
jgi:hypothetical protein